MAKKWVAWINYCMGGLVVFLLIAALWFVFLSSSDIPVPQMSTKKSDIPKGSFTRGKQDYDAIAAPVLNLNFAPMSMQLPDLRRYLIYYGKNGRPDSQLKDTSMHFAFIGNKDLSSVNPGSKLYVLYDKNQNPPQYIFSPDNAQTSLWIEPSVQGAQALVKVTMKGENGKIISEPASYSEFTLPEKEYVRAGGTVWEIGKWRVDGTLLARQKARWYGIDRFLEKHGGKEFQDFKSKQRIDFGENEEVYSVYAGTDDCMIWKDGHWKVVKPGPESLGYPLLCVKKVDERIMNLELWDVDGKGKLALNLLKSTENWMPQNIQQSFKFVGARTRTQFVFEINKERVLLSPHDWLILTDAGWKKLVTPKEIDEYVDRKITGPLFVFDGIDRKEDRQVIVGTMFNASRTEMIPIELFIQQTGTSTAANPADSKKRNGTSSPSMIKTQDQIKPAQATKPALKE